MKHYNVVCAVVLDSNQRALCVRKGATRYTYTSFRWEFPGGKIEEGETLGQALHRELLEELEYDVTVGKQLLTISHTYPDFAITMTAFLCTAASHGFKLTERIEAKWATRDEVKELAWCAADVPVVQLICDGLI